jgi:hypothetical protein
MRYSLFRQNVRVIDADFFFFAVTGEAFAGLWRMQTGCGHHKK